MSFPDDFRQGRRLSYLLVWAISSLALIPFVVFALFRPKLRPDLLERLGFGAWQERETFSCWIHGASVGEFQGIEPLLRHLQAEVDEDTKFFVSTTSLTGRARAQKSPYVSAARLLPYDHPLLVRSALRRIQPKLILIMETEIWPALFF